MDRETLFGYCNLYWDYKPTKVLTEALIGKIPNLHLLLIGEAPGEFEDITGLPFQGESGRILNMILSKIEIPFSFDITNTIACRPTKLSQKENVINRPPNKDEITKCKKRIQEYAQETEYNGTVHIGEIATQIRIDTPTVKIRHPSGILRQEYKLEAIKTQSRKINEFLRSI